MWGKETEKSLRMLGKKRDKSLRMWGKETEKSLRMLGKKRDKSLRILHFGPLKVYSKYY